MATMVQLQRENDYLKRLLERRPTSAQEKIKQAVSEKIEQTGAERPKFFRSAEKSALTREIRWQLHVRDIRDFRDEHLEMAMRVIEAWPRLLDEEANDERVDQG